MNERELNEALTLIAGHLMRMNTLAEVREVERLVHERFREVQAHEQRKAVEAKGLRVGTPVSFVARGRVFTGLVTKVNTKTVAVRTFEGQTWRVSPTFIRVANEGR